MYEVAAIRYGTRETSKRECYYRWDSYGEPDAPLVMDYFFWVLRTGGEAIVVDTGYHPDVGERRGRTLVCDPVDALRRLGVDPDAVPTVILTHLHYDHSGNLDAFPNAELVVHRRELDFWSGPDAQRAQFAAVIEPDEIARVVAAEREGRLRILDGDGEVAPGISSICVGGHSPGQIVLTIDGDRGPVVLASDAAHYYEELELDRPFEILVDLPAMYAGYETVRRLVAERSGAALVVGHDPEVMNRFPAVDGDAAGIAVRVA